MNNGLFQNQDDLSPYLDAEQFAFRESIHGVLSRVAGEEKRN